MITKWACVLTHHNFKHFNISYHKTREEARETKRRLESSSINANGKVVVMKVFDDTADLGVIFFEGTR